MRNWHNTAQKKMRSNPLYRKWEEMMKRRLPSFAARRPSYQGIVIAEEFLEFERFESWAKKQIGHDVPRWHLDKDALRKGNRTYGPEYCVFIPIEINSMLTIGRRTPLDLPIGVSQSSTGYMAICSAGGKRRTASGFSNPDDAFKAYKTMREEAIRAMAERWRGRVDERVYESLLNWQISITD